MKKIFSFFISIAALFFLMLFSNCSTTLTLTDISPDRNNGVPDGGASTAGLILNMAGDKNGLYAIGLNSGLWKTEIDNNGLFNKWRQLPQSPRYAHCIAVDPQLPEHIAVGEREGDAINIADNNCGLWESYDGGKTFDKKKYFNPISRLQCRTQVINAVAITSRSTTLISTPCGIGRKEYFEASFSFADAVSNQSFTSISIFKDWIVARTKDEIFISNNDGKSWEKHTIQLSFPSQNFTQDYIGERGGNYSVSIIQVPQSNDVFVYVPVTRTPNAPENFGSCVIFNNQTKQWSFQIIKQAGLGIALGGRVFMKSFFSLNTNLQNIIGGNTNLIYCAAQDIVKAKQINKDGTAEWEKIILVPNPSNFHSDIWDFLIDPIGWYSWAACDGGVYYNAMNRQQTTIALNIEQKYLNLNSGLHTQHIHSCFVAGFSGNTPGKEHYGYGTQDNDAWKKTPSLIGGSAWSVIGGTGDANWVAGDEGNTELILSARHFQNAVLAGLSSSGTISPLGAKIGAVNLNNNVRINGLQSFHFIQTLSSENPPPLLDAVALTTIPLKGSTDFETILVRNKTFASNPDISKGTGWTMEFNDLPLGVEGFWVSGGHADPTYYLLCNNMNARKLYKRDKNTNTWNIMSVSNINEPGEYGPVFVNPYNPYMIYVSCTDGVYYFVNAIGGGFFEKDIELTNLISENGKYPINRLFSGGNSSNVSHAAQANYMCPVSCISFNRYNPKQVVASSPFTGLFFKDGAKKWKDLSEVLPKPFTPISSVNINNQGIYATTEGRGMFLITNY